MGFECVYHYHEKIDGDYNKEETKTFKKKVGDPFDDVPLEKLAGAVMAQLARRDVWIVDVEVFELSKKSISFKEAKGGIVLKNKKFLFDGGTEEITALVMQDMSANQQTAVMQPQHVNIQGQSNFTSPAPTQTQPHNQHRPPRAIDYVVFSPELPQMLEVRQKNLRFTPDKKYPVYQKKPSPTGGEIFLMVDDTGREQLVSDKYFIPGNINLFGDKELGFSQDQAQRDGGNLYWGSANNEPDMPDIRRR